MSKDISSKYDDELENEFSDVDLALDMDYDEKTVSKSKKFDDNFKEEFMAAFEEVPEEKPS